MTLFFLGVTQQYFSGIAASLVSIISDLYLFIYFLLFDDSRRVHVCVFNFFRQFTGNQDGFRWIKEATRPQGSHCLPQEELQLTN